MAAMRLRPDDLEAARLLEESERRLFESRAVAETMAPPYRAEDVGAVSVLSVRVTRGVTQADRNGALFVAYEVSCTHSRSPTDVDGPAAPVAQPQGVGRHSVLEKMQCRWSSLQSSTRFSSKV